MRERQTDRQRERHRETERDRESVRWKQTTASAQVCSRQQHRMAFSLSQDLMAAESEALASKKKKKKKKRITFITFMRMR